VSVDIEVIPERRNASPGLLVVVLLCFAIWAAVILSVVFLFLI
jgi:hypothetical protein